MKHTNCNLQPKKEKQGQYYVAFNYCLDHEADVCKCNWEFGKHGGTESQRLNPDKYQSVTKEIKEKIISLYKDGLNYTQISTKVPQAYSTVRYTIKKHERNKVSQG